MHVVVDSTHPAAGVAALVGASSAIWYAVGTTIKSPWILPDEFSYGELARSIAAHASIASGDRIVYPLLISPAYLVSDPELAYALVKAINAVLISSTAIPAYLLARRVLPQRSALLAAALAVAVPSLTYAGELLSENAAYP